MIRYLIFLIFSMNLIGKDFEVKLYYSHNEVILNEPCYITVEIRNISGREIIIPYWWKEVKLEVRRADGKKRKQVISDEEYKVKTPMVGVKVKPGEFLIRIEDIFMQYEDEPGDFFVRYKYVSIGKEVELKDNGEKKIVKSWAGEIISEEVKIELKEPEGIDREAYEYFKGHPLAKPNELLEKYPTSTYAGWIMFSPGADLKYKGGYELIEDMLKPVNERKRWGTLVEKCEGKNYPRTKDGRYCIKSAEEEAKEYIRFAEAFLPLHNDHPNAGIIYARLFLAYMVVHRWEDAYEAGKKSLELSWAKWLYSSYPPQLEKEKKVLKEAVENLIKRGLVKNKK